MNLSTLQNMIQILYFYCAIKPFLVPSVSYVLNEGSKITNSYGSGVTFTKFFFAYAFNNCGKVTAKLSLYSLITFGQELLRVHYL